MSGVLGNWINRLWLCSVIISRCRYVLFISSLIIMPSLQAAPSGGQIVGGAGSIHQSGLTTTIQQQTGAMAIDWNTFNVNVDERVQFQQPDVSSIALNRILDQLPSQINGRLDANGRIVLVNPNGLFFGNNASVNVGGLIASGLDIDPMDFMNGDYQFQALENSAGTVFNAGLIQASLGGSVALLGKQVQNQGMISADLGIVALAAGKQAVLTFDHSGLLGLRITEAVLQDELGIDPAVLNSGDISAAGGKVLMTASVSQDVFSEAVNTGELQAARSVVVNADGSVTLGSGADLVNTGTVNVSSESSTSTGQIVMLGENITQSGVIRADQQTTTDTTNPTAGQIELHAQDTLLLTDNSLTSASADTGRGGEIILLGNQIGLFDQARLALNGDTGGGSLLFGGDLRGENPDIPNASAVYIGEATSIQADAIRDGDGGRIIIYATDSAKVFGSISATGGALGGDGGFLETSAGVVNLDFAVDVGAANGNSGQWLIDPFNLSICEECNDDANQTGNKFTPNGEDSELEVTTLTDALEGNSDNGGVTITIETGEVDTGMQDGIITLDTALDFNATNASTLILNAHHSIFINESINAAGTGTLNLELNADGLDSDGIGDVIIGDMVDSETIHNIQINTNGGSFTATTGNVTIDNAVTGDVTTGNVIIGNNVMLSETDNTDGTTTINTGGGAFTVNTGNIIGTIGGTGTVTIGNVTTGNVVIGDTDSADGTGTTTINTGGGLFDTKTGDITITSEVKNNGSVTVGDVITGTVMTGDTDGTGTTTINTGGGAFTVNTGNIIGTIGGTGTVTIGNVTTGNVMIGDTDSADGTGTTTINTGGGLFDTKTGDITITSTAGRDSIVTVGNVTTGDMLIGNINNTMIDTGGNTESGAFDAKTGQVTISTTVTNNGSVTIGNVTTGNVVIGDTDSADGTGTTTINTGSGAFTVNSGNVEINSQKNTVMGNVISGDVIINDGVTIDTVGEAFTANTGNITINNTIKGNNNNETPMDGDVITGNVIIGDIGNTAGTTTINTGGGLFDTKTGDITITSTLTGNGSASVAIGNVTTGRLLIGNIEDDINTNGTTIIDTGGNTENGAFDAETGQVTITSTVDNNGSVTIGNVTTGTVIIGDVNNTHVTTMINTGGGNFTANTGVINVIPTDGEVIEGTTIGDITIGHINNTDGMTTINTGGGAFTATGGSFGLGGVSSINTGDGAFTVDGTRFGVGVMSSINTGTGNLSITTDGLVDALGALTVGGATNINAGDGAITLSNAGNDFIGAVSLTNTGNNNVMLMDMNELELGRVNLGTGTLDITAVGITQSIAMDQAITAGAATFNAGAGVLSLNNTENTFTGAVSLNTSDANDATLNNSGALTLATSSIGGNLTVTATAGNITQTETGALDVDGIAAFTTDKQDDMMMTEGKDIILEHADNSFNIVKLTGHTARILDSDDIRLELGDVTLTGNLHATSSTRGVIQQDGGTLNITGNATFMAGDNRSIKVLNAGNNVGGTVSFTVSDNGPSDAQLDNIEFANNNPISLGALDISGDLTLHSTGGSVGQDAAWIVGGITNINAGGGAITLSNENNAFTGAVSLSTKGTHAIDLVNSVALQLSDVTLEEGALTITATTGNITQSANTKIMQQEIPEDPDDMIPPMFGAVTFTVAGTDPMNKQSIVLEGANDIQGTVSFVVPEMAAGLQDLSFTNVGDITQGTLNIAGDLTLNSTEGSVGQTDAWVVSGLADIKASGGTENNNINLGVFQNDFTELQLTANDATVQDANSLTLGAGAIDRDLTITTTGNLTIVNDGETVPAEALDVGRDLTITSNGGDIDAVNGALVVVGDTSINAGSGSITLSNAGNDFIGAVSLENTGTNAIEIVNSTDLQLGNITLEQGALTITATPGTATTGKITQIENTKITQQAIDSEDPSPMFGAVSFTAAGAIDLDSETNQLMGAVSLNNGNPNITLVNNGALKLGKSDVGSGTLMITAKGGDITQSGILTGSGMTTFTVDGGQGIEDGYNIILDRMNELTGGVGFNVATGTMGNIHDLTFTNSVMDIGALTVDNKLTLNSTGGGITQSGIWQVNEVADLTANGGVTLLDSMNDFNALKLNAPSASIAVADSIELRSINITGDFDITAHSGDISQSGNLNSAMTVVGAATFTTAGLAGNGENITLTNEENNLQQVVTFAALQGGQLKDIAFTNAQNITLGALDITGNLTLNSRLGSVGQGQAANVAWVIGGLANLTAATDILLNNSQNNFASLQLSANTATVHDMNGITLSGTSTISKVDNAGGNLTLVSNGDINASSGVLVVDGMTDITAVSGAITLSNENNAFTGAVSLENTGMNAIEIDNSTDLQLGNITLEQGALSVTAHSGDITQSMDTDKITQQAIDSEDPSPMFGAVSFTAAGAITLGNADNQLMGAVSLNNGNPNITLVNNGALKLGKSDVGSGTLMITAKGGDITQSGILTGMGNDMTTFTVDGGQNITLTENNALTGGVGFNVATDTTGNINNLSFTNSRMELGALTIDGNLTIEATGNADITQTGALDVDGMATFTAIGNDIVLESDSNNFGSVQLIGQTARIVDSNVLELGAVDLSGNLVATASDGNIRHQDADAADKALIIDGTAEFTVAHNNAIRLLNPYNNILQNVTFAVSGTDDVKFKKVEFANIANITLGALEIIETLELNSIGGNVTQTGAWVVSGTDQVTPLTNVTAGMNITLEQMENDFGSLKLTGVNATVTNNSALALAGADLSGMLDLNVTNGSITQLTDNTQPNVSGLSIGGTATFEVVDGQSITLNNLDNNIVGNVIFNGELFSLGLTNTASITLGELDLSGDLTLNSTGGSVAQAANVAWVIGGSVDLSAMNDITVNTLNFTDSLTLHSIAGDLMQSGTSAIVQMASTDPGMGPGNVILMADMGSINLNNVGNDFLGTVFLTASGSGDGQGDATVQDANSLTLGAGAIDGGLTITTTGNLTIVNDGETVPAEALDVGRDLTITSNGGDIDAVNGALVVVGDTSINAGSGSITLSNAGNDFIGVVSLLSGSNATLMDSNSLNLGRVNLGTGTLNITAVGITQSTAMDQAITAGAATFNAGAGILNLNNAENTFTGAVSLNNGNADVMLVNKGTLDLGVSNVGSGALMITAKGGGITQSDILTGSGMATFTVDGGQGIENGYNIILDLMNALTGEVGFNAAADTMGNINNLTFTNSVINLGALTIDGSLTLKSIGIGDDGGVMQSGAWTVVGTTDINAGDSSITLSNDGNDFIGRVLLENSGANNVEIVTNGALQLGAINVGSGTLDISAVSITQDAAITQTAQDNTAGAVTFTAAAEQNIILDNEMNNFIGALNFMAATDTGKLMDITISNIGDIDLGDIDITGKLSATSTAGNITQSTELVVGNGAQFQVKAGLNIELLDPDNAIDGIVIFAALGNGQLNDIEFANNNTITLGELNITGDLTLNSTGGSVVQTAMWTAGGSADLRAMTDITVDILNFTDSLTLHSIAGNVMQSDTGAIVQMASTDPGMGPGNVTLMADMGSINLNNAGNDFLGTVFLTASGSVDEQGNATVQDANSLTLGAGAIDRDLTVTTMGNLTIVHDGEADPAEVLDVGRDLTITSNGGDIDAVNGALVVAGVTDINAGSGAITLSNLGNDFTGAVSLTNSGNNNVTLIDSNALNLGLVNIGTGTLNITAVGITQSVMMAEAITAGAATFNAGAGILTLGNTGNTFTGAVSLNNSDANDATLNNSGALTLATSSIGGNLTVTATAGNITQTGALDVDGIAAFTTDKQDDMMMTEGKDIILEHADNSFNIVELTGRNARIVDSNVLELGAVDLSGNLVATASDGNIRHQDSSNTNKALNIMGNATFKAAGGKSINLQNTGNAIVGTVTFTALNDGQFDNIRFANNNTITLGALNITGDLTLNSTGGAIILAESSVGGDLSVTAGTDTIQQSGGLSVAGSASFTAAAGQNIVLGNTDNNFIGALNFMAATDTGKLMDITISNIGDIDLGDIDIDGTLTATSTEGNIIQSAGLMVGGNATFTVAGTVAGDSMVGSDSIFLNNPDNNLIGTVTFAALDGGQLNNIAFTNSNTITLGALDITGDLTLNSTGVSGSVGQGAAWVVGGLADLSATADILLDQTQNDFASLKLTGVNATVTNNSTLALAGADLSGNLILTLGAGSITQLTNNSSEALLIKGMATFTVNDDQSIELNNLSNDLADDVIFNGKLFSLGLTNTADITLGALTLGGDLTLNSTNGSVGQTADVAWVISGSADLSALNAITLGALNVTNDLTLNSATGSVGQGAAWVVGGLADLTAATDIILDNFPNDFGSLKLTGANARVNATVNLNNDPPNNDPLVLAGANLSGTLDLNVTNGSITQLTNDSSEALLIKGMATFTVNDGQSIELNNPFNDLAGEVILNGDLTSLGLTNTADITVGELTLNGNLTLNSTEGSVEQSGAWVIGGSADLSALNAITLGELNITNNLTLNSTGGSVGQTAAWVVGGLADLSANTDITLQDMGNNFASLQLSANTASVHDMNGITLSGTSTISKVNDTGGNLTLVSNGDINANNGVLVVDGMTDINAGSGAITLSNMNNTFTGAVSLQNTGTHEISLVNSIALKLGDVMLEEGALSVTANSGSITQSADAKIMQQAISGNPSPVFGAVTITANAGAITLGSANNKFLGSVLLNNGDADVILVNSGALKLGTSTVGSGALNITAVGITQSGAVTAGAATFNAGAGILNLNNAGNAFTGAVSLNNGDADVTFVNSGALDLGMSNVGSGTLDITADGITQTGAITQANNAGLASFDAGAGVLTLDNAGNAFTGTVSLNNSGTNNVILVNSGALMLGTSIVGTGTLDITAVGITQSGAITQANNAGLASFDAGAGVLSLNNAANAFTGAVSLTNSGNNNVTLVNNSDLELGDITFDDGELLISANSGNITQASDTRIRQLGTNEMTFTADMGAITLANVDDQDEGVNDFRGQLLLDANAATLADFNSIALGTGAIDTDLTITVTNGVEIITDDQLLIGNNLTMTGGGVMDARQGALVVGGDTTITGTSILLSNTGNALTGTVSLHSQGDNAILLFNTSDLQLGDITLSNGAMIITAETGDITQSGAITQTGTDNVIFSVADNQSIQLLNSGNDIRGTVAFNGALQSLGFTNKASITLDALTLNGDLTLNSTGVSGSVEQNGAWVVGGLADLSAATDIILDNFQNDFTSLKLTGVNATVTNSSALALAGADLSGTLNLTLSNGSITQLTDPMAALLIDGTATFTVQDGESITLDNDFNDFAGDVIFNGELASLGLTNTADITLGALNLSGDLTLNSTGGSVAQTADVAWVIDGSADLSALNAITLGVLDITNDLTLNSATGSVGQTAAWVVGGLADLTANTDITLRDMGNNFASLQLSANTATVHDMNGITLSGTSTISKVNDTGGNLTLVSNGDINASNGVLVVDGITDITAGSGAITLSNENNAFTGAVSLQNTGTHEISLVSSMALKLGDVMLEEGALSITANSGNITQSANTKIMQQAIDSEDPSPMFGAVSFTAAGAIDLDSTTNQLMGAVSLQTTGNHAIELVNNSDLNLGSILFDQGALTITAEMGDITQDGAIIQIGTGEVMINALAGAINVNNSNNQIRGAVSLASTGTHAISLVNNIGLDLGDIILEEGALSVTANSGSIMQSANTKIMQQAIPENMSPMFGAVSFTANAGAITLGSANNKFLGSVSLNNSGDHNVTLVNSGALKLGTSTVGSGALNINANAGDITQTGSLSVDGIAEFTAADGQNIILDNADNNLNGALNFSAITDTDKLKDITISNTGSIDLGNIDIDGTLTATSTAGDITQSTALIVGGNATFSLANLSSIKLINEQNNLQGTVTFAALDGGQLNNVGFTNNRDINLGALNITGNLIIDSSGEIQQNGSLQVAELADFTAAGAITLTDSANQFDTLQLNAASADIQVADDVQLGSITIGEGALSITANSGNITQSGAIVQQSVDPNNPPPEFGAVTFTVAGKSQDSSDSIVLDNEFNNLQGAVTFAVLDGGQLNNVEFTNNQNINLGALNITGDLTINSVTGDITQSGALTVAGLAEFIAQNDISLNNSNNALTTIALQSTTASIDNSGAIMLNASTITDSFTLNVTGDIGQTGVLTVGGLASFTSAGDITLDANNQLTKVSLSGTNVILHNSGALELAGAEVTGNFSLSLGSGRLSQTAAIAVDGDATFELANAQQVSLTDDNNAVLGLVTFTASSGSLGKLDFTNNGNLLLGALNINGDATLKSVTGDIEQDGAFSVTGVLQLQANAENGEVTFDNKNNALTSVELFANSAIITNQNSLSLGLSNITGVAELESINGNIQQTDAVQDAVQIDTLIAMAAGDVQLTNTANDFGTVTVLDAVNVSLVDSNSIVLNGITTTGTLNVTARSGGDISQLNEAGLIINGLANFSVDAGRDIVLENENNQFSGGIGFAANSSGLLRDIRVRNSEALQLQALNITGGLTVTTIAGDITQAGELIVAGATTLMAAGNVTLESTTNNFGIVTVSNAANVSLVDSNSIVLNGITASGTLDVTARSGGDISQLNGAGLIIDGLATFTVDGGRDIILENPNNRFGDGIGFVATSGLLNNIRVANSQALQLQALNISGDLTVTTTAGDITQAGVLTIARNAEFNAGNGSVILLDQANDFIGAARFNTNGDVMVVDSNRLLLGGSSVGGSFSATAGSGSNIEQEDIIGIADGLSITGLATFIAEGGQSIQLGNLDNQLNQVTFESSNTQPLANLAVANATGLSLPNLVLSGDLTITTQGAITDSGALTIAGLASLDAGSGNAIELDDNHDFNSLLIQNAGDVFITDINALTIATANAIDNLTLSTAGTLTQNDQLIVNQLTQLSAFNAATGVAQDIVLDADNNLTTLIVQIANNLSLNNAANALFIDQLNAVGNASVVAGDMTVNAVTAQQGVALTAQTAGLQQIGQIDVQNGDAILTAAQTLLMSDTSSTSVASGNIQYSASGNVFLAQLSANNGDVNVVSTNGQLLDNNGVALNLQGPSVTLSAATGIGITGAIDTATGLLSATNASGNLNLSNSGAVEIQSLSSVGDIDFTNTGDVNVNPGSIDAGLGIGFVIMDVNNGNLFGIGPTPIVADADITGISAIMGVEGEIGTEARPIIYNVFGGVADDSGNTLSVGLSTLLLGIASGDRLVEIETLGEIDPAIFTDLRNYSQEDIAIRLPNDQLYDDELDNYSLLPFRLFSGAAMTAF